MTETNADIGKIVHDLRSSLAVIQTSAEAGLLEPKLSASTRETLEDILKAVQTAAETSSKIPLSR